MALVCLIFAFPAWARRRAVDGGFPFAHILFVGAHPDDETVIAPLLGRYCNELASRCAFIVLTRGENGDCAIPGGCGDLGTLRAAEMQRAANLFGGTLSQWTYPDRLDDVAQAWSAAADGRDALVDRIRDAIRSEGPTAVITFDPAHGTTCHPAHRELGDLVADAVDRLGAAAPPLYFMETAATYQNGLYSFADAITTGSSFVAGGEQWKYLAMDAGVHASQFTSEQIASFRTTPEDQRRVYLAAAPTVRNAVYSFRCP